MEIAAGKIGEVQVGLINRLSLVRKIELKKYQLVAIRVRFAEDVESSQVPAEVPPFGFIVVRCLVLRDAHQWRSASADAE
jgi:hypothetical protein